MTYFLLVGLIIWKGAPWAYIVYVERPVSYFLGGAAMLFAWYFLQYGIHNSRTEWKTVAAKLTLLVFSLFFSLLGAEIAMRTYYSMRQAANSMDRFKAIRKNGKPLPIISSHPLAVIIQPSDHQKLVYELQQNLDMDFGHKRVRTNSDGIRSDRNYAIPAESGTFRIVGIGDSGMFGWNMEQNDDYLGVLETNLNRRQDGRRYEVLNLAVPGYNTQMEVEMLRCKGLKYKPDIVIVGWCENDYSLPFFMLEKENYWKRDRSYVYDLLFKRNVPRNERKRTEVAPGFKITDQRDFNRENVLPEWTSGSDVDRVRSALEELKELSEQHNFKVLLFGSMEKPIKKLCKEIGIKYSNIYELIPKGTYPEEYVIYFMHPNKKGHAVLAEHLEKDLVKRGWLTDQKQGQ